MAQVSKDSEFKITSFMNSILTCKGCGNKIQSPVQGPPGSIQGPPGSMVTTCPKCGNKVDILYD